MIKEQLNLQEKVWEKLLHISTTGRDATKADSYRYPYEPTPYCVLERLANSGLIGKRNTLVDYGCGKGRVDFFLANQTRCNATGIEYDERIYERAAENQKTAISGQKVTMVHANAEEFLPEGADRFYFFNPFSVEILRHVMAKIKETYYAQPREMLLFFYFPSDEYMGYLMTVPELEFYDEIDCSDLFEEDANRERIVIFKME